MTTILKSPMVYFGGKSSIAEKIWERFGVTDRFSEPFFGSGAVLLANPHPDKTFEVVNDLDHFVANVWRSLKASPEETAYFADQPTNEIELHLNHLWLVNEGRKILKQCAFDDVFHSPECAGRWLLGNANWIGSNFAKGDGGWTKEHFEIAEETKTYNIHEINRKLPHLSGGKGINRKLPHLSGGKGINRKLPHLSGGQGINRQLSHLADNGRGVNRLQLQSNDTSGSIIPINQGLYDYFAQIARRLRNVNVCCGDWKRVVQPSVTQVRDKIKGNATCSVFLDPPYADENRSDLYAQESYTVAQDVREWCKENGKLHNYRIALCGYDGEHNELESLDWSVLEWKATGGYSGQGDADSQGKKNKHKERIWFSPGCLQPDQSLFSFLPK